MSEEKKISRKTLKIILGVCIGAMAALTVGFFAYIHIADTNTLGRKISIYGLDVSRLSTADAKQKILTAFQNKKIDEANKRVIDFIRYSVRNAIC